MQEAIQITEHLIEWTRPNKTHYEKARTWGNKKKKTKKKEAFKDSTARTFLLVSMF